MRNLFLGTAAVLVVISIGYTLDINPARGDSVARAIISAAFAISGGLALVAAAISKGDK